MAESGKQLNASAALESRVTRTEEQLSALTEVVTRTERLVGELARTVEQSYRDLTRKLEDLARPQW